MSTVHTIDGHEVLALVEGAGRPLPVGELESEVVGRWGLEARFHGCAGDNITLEELLAHFAGKGRLVVADGMVAPGTPCAHHGPGCSHHHHEHGEQAETVRRLLVQGPQCSVIAFEVPSGRTLAGTPSERPLFVQLVGGAMEWTIGTDTSSGDPGDLLFIPPHTEHQARALSDARFVLTVLPGDSRLMV